MQNDSFIKNLLETNSISFEKNKDLTQITWIKRGGVAKFFLQPQNINELKKISTLLYSNNIPFDLMGGSTNLYCLPTYNPRILLSTTKLKNIDIMEDYIECETGVLTALLARKCCEENFDGYAGLVNLPGTVGGAICNNASAFNSELSANLLSATIVDHNGKIKEICPTDFHFSHRSSALKRNEKRFVIVSCKFKKTQTIQNQNVIARQNAEIRKKTQQGPTQNLGSIFTGNKIRRLKRSDFPNFRKFVNYIIMMLQLKYLRKKYYKVYAQYKNFLLDTFCQAGVSKYVSDKNINCYIWKDNNADLYFESYEKFMKEYNISSTLEIEIRK